MAYPPPVEELLCTCSAQCRVLSRDCWVLRNPVLLENIVRWPPIHGEQESYRPGAKPSSLDSLTSRCSLSQHHLSSRVSLTAHACHPPLTESLKSAFPYPMAVDGTRVQQNTITRSCIVCIESYRYVRSQQGTHTTKPKKRKTAGTTPSGSSTDRGSSLSSTASTPSVVSFALSIQQNLLIQ